MLTLILDFQDCSMSGLELDFALLWLDLLILYDFPQCRGSFQRFNPIRVSSKFFPESCRLALPAFVPRVPDIRSSLRRRGGTFSDSGRVALSVAPSIVVGSASCEDVGNQLRHSNLPPWPPEMASAVGSRVELL